MRRFTRLGDLWRRSLQFRVVVSTLAISALIVGLLGAWLINQVADRLVEAKTAAAIGEAAAGVQDAQRILDASPPATTPDAATTQVDSVVSSLAARAGDPPLYDVLMLAVPGKSPVDAPGRGSNTVSAASVSEQLRTTIEQSGRQAWAPTEIVYVDGATKPGLAVGAPLTVPGVGEYQLYYLFPYTQEQQDLQVIRGPIVVTALALVLLLVGLAWLVARQVVSRVQVAAQTAERFRGGHLDERMEVDGYDEISVLARSFNGMAESIEDQIEQLEDLSQVQQQFVSDVSHELRTPLTTIRMASDVIYADRDALSDSPKRAAELLAGQLDRFESMLADLLEISRFDAGAASAEFEPTDLARLLSDEVAAAEPLASARGAELRLVTPKKPRPTVHCDGRRVRRIVRNLVVNGIEHGSEASEDGQPGEVLVELRFEGDEAHVLVSDHGRGLTPEEAARVFDRFWRADPSRQRNVGGTGLGLAISDQDARLHGGTLTVSSAPGDGATFTLALPLSPASDDEDADANRVELASLGAPADNAVDDSAAAGVAGDSEAGSGTRPGESGPAPVAPDAGRG